MCVYGKIMQHQSQICSVCLQPPPPAATDYLSFSVQPSQTEARNCPVFQKQHNLWTWNVNAKENVCVWLFAAICPSEAQRGVVRIRTYHCCVDIYMSVCLLINAERYMKQDVVAMVRSSHALFWLCVCVCVGQAFCLCIGRWCSLFLFQMICCNMFFASHLHVYIYFARSILILVTRGRGLTKTHAHEKSGLLLVLLIHVLLKSIQVRWLIISTFYCFNLCWGTFLRFQAEGRFVTRTVTMVTLHTVASPPLKIRTQQSFINRFYLWLVLCDCPPPKNFF